MHIASEGKVNISEKDASMLFKKKDERISRKWVPQGKRRQRANGMNAKDLAAIFEGKQERQRMDSLEVRLYFVPMDKETLPVDVEAVKKAEEENKLIMENRLKVRSEKRAAAAAGLNTNDKVDNSKEKHTKAAAKKAAKAPTNANAGSILTDDVLPGFDLDRQTFSIN